MTEKGKWPKAVTEEERQFMRDNAELLTVKDIAEKLGRAEITVRKFLQKERLIEKRTVKQRKKRTETLETDPVQEELNAIRTCHEALCNLSPIPQARAISYLIKLLGLRTAANTEQKE